MLIHDNDRDHDNDIDVENDRDHDKDVCVDNEESLHVFLSSAFGPEVDFTYISTRHPTITTPIFQNYTVSESPREIESPKKVVFHPKLYLYAVYFCHFVVTETKTFKLQLDGDITGDKVDALVVCHMDISGWSSDHSAFREFGIKHGDALCHVFPQGNHVWINQPSAVDVSAE
ncbi:BURP domain-containing protein BNM2A-like [Hibiscus syriacus]|uniref:BURP domain-containing protein BNM2A-like n=1 Tax=Hibiscus syriacus TaxID=106335 RepID=UPI0019218737|nr:BURP domain-containing protein BNM2A-like [Hibiscus syriacus]